MQIYSYSYELLLTYEQQYFHSKTWLIIENMIQEWELPEPTVLLNYK